MEPTPVKRRQNPARLYEHGEGGVRASPPHVRPHSADCRRTHARACGSVGRRSTEDPIGTCPVSTSPLHGRGLPSPPSRATGINRASLRGRGSRPGRPTRLRRRDTLSGGSPPAAGAGAPQILDKLTAASASAQMRFSPCCWMSGRLWVMVKELKCFGVCWVLPCSPISGSVSFGS
jgi:hypothetical protein